MSVNALLQKYPYLPWAFPVVVFATTVAISLLVRLLRPRRSVPAPEAISAGRDIRRVSGVLFGTIFLLAGVGFLIPMVVLPVVRSVRARSWPTTDGVVISSRVLHHLSDEGRGTYSIDIQYNYRVNGTAYTGTRYDTTIGSTGGASAKQAVVDRFPPGKHVQVFYDRADPSKALLSAANPSSVYGIVWFPLLFMAVGAGILYFSLRRTTETAGQMGGPISGKGKARQFHQPMTAGGATRSSIDSRRARRGKMIGITIFTLIWNGFIAAFFYATRTWCLAPFVLIDLLLIVAVIYSAMALFNPVVKIDFDSVPLVIGRRAVLNYRIDGNIMAITLFRMYLEGLEQVTFQQGTNSRTESKVIWTIPLLETTNRADMERGKVSVTISPGAMPSFASRHNAFIWRLKCSGEIPRWPDIDDAFAVEVVAGEGA